MKKTILTLFTLLIVATSYAQNRTATVTPENGILIFIDCQPTDQYEYLGENKIYIIWSGTAKAFKRKHIRKIKRKIPNAYAILWSTKETDIATAIKFK